MIWKYISKILITFTTCGSNCCRFLECFTTDGWSLNPPQVSSPVAFAISRHYISFLAAHLCSHQPSGIQFLLTPWRVSIPEHSWRGCQGVIDGERWHPKSAVQPDQSPPLLGWNWTQADCRMCNVEQAAITSALISSSAFLNDSS